MLRNGADWIARSKVEQQKRNEEQQRRQAEKKLKEELDTLIWQVESQVPLTLKSLKERNYPNVEVVSIEGFWGTSTKGAWSLGTYERGATYGDGKYIMHIYLISDGRFLLGIEEYQGDKSYNKGKAHFLREITEITTVPKRLKIILDGLMRQ